MSTKATTPYNKMEYSARRDTLAFPSDPGLPTMPELFAPPPSWDRALPWLCVLVVVIVALTVGGLVWLHPAVLMLRPAEQRAMGVFCGVFTVLFLTIAAMVLCARRAYQREAVQSGAIHSSRGAQIDPIRRRAKRHRVHAPRLMSA